MKAKDRIAFPADDDIDDVEPVEVLKESSRESNLASMGMAAFCAVICFCLLGFAVPLLVISLIKSPEALQNVAIGGVSYQQLVCAFLLSAAIIAYICMFFLKPGPLAILAFFAFSVFSCFPLIVGLRKNLTLPQTIMEIPFFQTWPFFLRPGYTLIEFLIPAAIIACLVLQIRSLLSRKPYRYTFLFVAFYLGIAAFFGFSALTQAGQPNIVHALSWIKETREKQPPLRRSEIQLPSARDTGGPEGPTMNLPPVGASKAEIASGSETGVQFERKVQILSDKVDRILEVLTQAESRPGVPSATVPAAKGEAGKDPSPKSRAALAGGGEPVTDKPAMEDLISRVQTLSEKVERILGTLTQMQAVLPGQENPSADKGTARATNVVRPRPDSKSALQAESKTAKKPGVDKPDLKDLSQRVQVLSDKMDRFMEILAKVEGLLPEQGKGPGKK